jgi:hypothetical protein
LHAAIRHHTRAAEKIIAKRFGNADKFCAVLFDFERIGKHNGSAQIKNIDCDARDAAAIGIQNQQL